jgi:hypothetical protein
VGKGGVSSTCLLEGRLFSLQQETLALVPRMYSCLLDRSERRLEPSGFSNAMTREEELSFWRVVGGQTQLGFCVTVSAAYEGL